MIILPHFSIKNEPDDNKSRFICPRVRIHNSYQYIKTVKFAGREQTTDIVPRMRLLSVMCWQWAWCANKNNVEVIYKPPFIG
jgi:hypothetical protein